MQACSERHLAPSWGGKTPLSPEPEDRMVFQSFRIFLLPGTCTGILLGITRAHSWCTAPHGRTRQISENVRIPPVMYSRWLTYILSRRNQSISSNYEISSSGKIKGQIRLKFSLQHRNSCFQESLQCPLPSWIESYEFGPLDLHDKSVLESPTQTICGGSNRYLCQLFDHNPLIMSEYSRREATQ